MEATVYQNEFLPVGGTDINAIVAFDPGADAPPAIGAAAEIIVVDGSVSMKPHLDTLLAAAETAIKLLDPGSQFAVLVGTHRAKVLCPLKPVNEGTQNDAVKALRALTPEGGTAMGTWLKLAAQVFTVGQAPAPRHVLLIGDGGNRNELPEQFLKALQDVTGQFSADCLDIGADPEPGDLRYRLATALGGQLINPITDPQQLENVLTMALRRFSPALASPTLRLWLPVGTELLYLKQVSPDVTELPPPTEITTYLHDYPLRWTESAVHEYHLGIRVPPSSVGKEQLAARLELRSGHKLLANAQIQARWSSPGGPIPTPPTPEPATEPQTSDFYTPPVANNPPQSDESDTTLLK
ncbi:MAG: VWA domain-containing protein [Propionibacteriaceae bacterium]|jgi:hypothetical protein|nr:VWA domain-containing protein [Propionibacteriaceae bacterium]